MEKQYQIDYFPVERIVEIADMWRYLESGVDMTYYQRYDWYEKLAGLNSKKYVAHEILFALVRSIDGDAVMIAPLWIVKHRFRLINKKGAYFFGCQGWNDYCNFIYRDFSPQAMICLMDDLYARWGITYYRFDYMKEETMAYRYIADNKFDIEMVCDKSSIAVGLALPGGEAEYRKMLSKNARQNLRTAANRMKKMGVEYVICYNDRDIDLEQFCTYRKKRVAEKNRWTIKSFIFNTKMWLLGQLRYQFPYYTPFDGIDMGGRFLTIKVGNVILASFCYVYDAVHREILIMAVSLNEDYSWYSPGMVAMYNFIIDLLGNDTVDIVDFTRGNEKYKYSLGGTEHYIHSVRFYHHSTIR